MDPSAMDFVMHQPDQGAGMSLPPVDPRGNRSRCPALRMTEHHHHQQSIPSFRPNYQFDPVHNPLNFWQPLPPPQNPRWSHDQVYEHSQSLNVNRLGYPLVPGGLNPYNAHQMPAFDYRTPMPSLQRIGNTAPIQHSQGNFSVPNPGQGGQGGQNQSIQHQTQTQQPVAGHGSGAGGFASNGTLPPLNPMAPNMNQTRPVAFNQTSRPAQQPSRHSSPPFVRQTSSIPTTNLSIPDTTITSRSSEAASSHSASSTPPSTAADAVGEEVASEQHQTSTNRNRRGLPRLPSSDSGWSSDDDSDRDAVTMSLIETGGSTTPGTEDRMRAHQIMRGAVSSKRVASKKALTSLESVIISDLPKNERTCVICYNDYGAETPEGISEIPLRLPKCKHVFGDHCIKKWFDESDSCPYCRDKVPSEPQYRQSMATHNMYRFFRQHQLRERGELDSSIRPSNAMYENYASYAALASGSFGEYEYGGLGYRRADGAVYGSRNPAWHGTSAERHSPLPFAEASSENRRRARSHRGSLRFPPGRPHFPTAAAGSASQSQAYPWLTARQPPSQVQSHTHNHRHSSSSSNAGIRTMAENVHPLSFQPQMGGLPEPYLNPLNMGNSGGAPEDYHNLPHMRPIHAQQALAISPTYPGPEVYMSNADDANFGGTGTHNSM